MCRRTLSLRRSHPLVMATGRRPSNRKAWPLLMLPNTGRPLLTGHRPLTGRRLLLPNTGPHLLTGHLQLFLNTGRLLAPKVRWLSLPNTGSFPALRNTVSLLAINTGRLVPEFVTLSKLSPKYVCH